METKIAGLHFKETPVKGKKVKLTGYLKYYENKRWHPVEHKKVRLLVNEEVVGESITDSYGKFSFDVILNRDSTIRVEFDGAYKLNGCFAEKYVSVITEDKLSKVKKLAEVVFFFIVLAIVITLLIAFILR